MKCVYLVLFLALQCNVFPHVRGNDVVQVERLADEERIINGETAGQNQYPWMAAIYRQTIYNNRFPVEVDTTSTFKFACGGSILSEKVILTAAHCLYYYSLKTNIALTQYPNSSIRVGYGEDDINYLKSNTLAVENCYIHPQYNTITYQHDVALLMLKDKINLRSEGVGVIGICSKVIGVGESVTVAGWGDTCSAINQYHLRQAVMTTIPTDRCYTLSYNSDGTSILCTGPDTHIGSGDSGGGLWLTKAKTKSLVGIVSVGSSCENINLPQTFTRLSTYREWVSNMMKIHT